MQEGRMSEYDAGGAGGANAAGGVDVVSGVEAEVMPQAEPSDRMLRFSLMSSEERERVIEYGLLLLDMVTGEAERVEGGQLLAEARGRVEELESERALAISVATEAGRQAARGELDGKLAEAEARCRMLEERGHAREDAVRRECDGRVEQLHNRLEAVAIGTGVRNKSTVRGEEGEQKVGEMLLRMFPTAEISDERRRRGRGDFVVTLNTVHMMLEVKNYTKNVTKAEITKFERDMRENPEYTCGVLASLSSGVCSKEDFSLEILNDRPVLYIHRLTEDPNRLRCAMRLFELMHSLENVDLSKTGVIDQVQRELTARRHRVAALQGLVDRHCKELKELIAKEDEETTKTLELVIGKCG